MKSRRPCQPRGFQCELLQPHGPPIRNMQVSRLGRRHQMRARPVVLMRPLTLTPPVLEVHLICNTTVSHTISCCATWLIHLVHHFFVVESNDLLMRGLPCLKPQPIINLVGILFFLTYPFGGGFGMPKKILVQLEEGVF